MSDQPAPDDILALAEERSRARAARDWVVADDLKARIEAAGWRVVDSGADYDLSPSHPPDLVEDGQLLYGAVEAVPSRSDEPASAAATTVVIGMADGPSPDPVLGALARHEGDDTQVIVVAERSLAVGAPAAEIIRTVEAFSPGDALQAALRRAVGEVIVVVDPARIPSGPIVAPLSGALADETVAVAGVSGMDSGDLRRYRPAGPGDVTALCSGAYAFRRRDALRRGPIDGHLYLPGSVAIWWSLTLRDEGPDAEPRRAVALDLSLSEPVETPALADDHRRRARRDAYRIADRFAGHAWLARPEEEVGGMPGDGRDGDRHDDDADEGGHTPEA